jgi:hypothetical protein
LLQQPHTLFIFFLKERELLHKEREELEETLLVLSRAVNNHRGTHLADCPEAKLNVLAETLDGARAHVGKMILRCKAEARVSAKYPDYNCPISQALMRDPVITDDGQSYERKEIEAWFQTQREANEPLTSPLRAPLKSAQLVANHSLRRAIEAAVQAEQAS